MNKMKLTLIIFGLLFGSVIKAYPSWEPDSDEDEEDHRSSHSDSSLSHLVPPKNKEECEKNLAWFKNGTETTKRLYDEYYSKLRLLNLTEHDTQSLKPQHDLLEHHMTESLEKYDQERNKTLSITDSTALLISCGKQMDWQKLLQHNLTGIAKNMQTDVLNIADRLGVPKEMREDLDKTLARVVNFLFIIDMTRNTFKDMGSLLKTAYEKTDEYLAKRRAEKANKKAGVEEVTEKEITADYGGDILDDNNDLDNDLSHVVDDLEKDEKIIEKQAEEQREQQIEERQEETNEVVEEGIEAEHYNFEGRAG